MKKWINFCFWNNFFSGHFLTRRSLAPKSDIFVKQASSFNRDLRVTSTLVWSSYKYSEKATKFCEISTLLLTVCTVVKSKVDISQNLLAFSEYMKFITDLF